MKKARPRCGAGALSRLDWRDTDFRALCSVVGFDHC